MVKIRRYTGYVLLFLAVVMADAWLFHSLQEMTDRKTEDVSDTVRADMVYFPVPESSYDTNGYGVSFSDSWMDARNFGGERYHEGCDIMAAIDKRGHYPVVSISELLSFMGDTGYSETEGTTGYFPVHLHIGIYLNDENGEEKSYNPYPFLKELESNKLKFCFE